MTTTTKTKARFFHSIIAWWWSSSLIKFSVFYSPSSCLYRRLKLREGSDYMYSYFWLSLLGDIFQSYWWYSYKKKSSCAKCNFVVCHIDRDGQISYSCVYLPPFLIILGAPTITGTVVVSRLTHFFNSFCYLIVMLLSVGTDVSIRSHVFLS